VSLFQEMGFHDITPALSPSVYRRFGAPLGAPGGSRTKKKLARLEGRSSPMSSLPTTRPKRANATLRGTRPSSQCRPDPVSDLRISPTSAQRTPSDSPPSIF